MASSFSFDHFAFETGGEVAEASTEEMPRWGSWTASEDEASPELKDTKRARLLSPVLPGAGFWTREGHSMNAEASAAQLETIQIGRVAKFRQVSEARMRPRKSGNAKHNRTAAFRGSRQPEVVLNFHRVNESEYGYDAASAGDDEWLRNASHR